MADAGLAVVATGPDDLRRLLQAGTRRSQVDEAAESLLLDDVAAYVNERLMSKRRWPIPANGRMK
jgi:hypothetical protein